MPGRRPAKLCLCSAAQCCADAFQILAIPWPSFSFLRSALPPRFGTMPVRNTAMLWLHISLPAPPCSVLCPGYAAHIRRSTILCQRISVQSLVSALPVYASAGQISSQPCHTVALPSYALPQPCSTIPSPCLARPRVAKTGLLSSVHFHFPAFRFNAMPRLFAAMPCQCCAMLCQSFSTRINAQAPLCNTFPKHFFALPELRHAVHCLFIAQLFLCNSGAELNATVPLLFIALLCLYESVLYKTYPLPSESLLRLAFAFLGYA